MTTQRLLFVGEWEPSPGGCGLLRALPVPLADKPSAVWTLLAHTDPDKPPALPCRLTRADGVMSEDEMHDWAWRGGKLRYFSRAGNGPVWLLLEYR